MERKVVITGMGIWSCLGKTLEDVRDSLYTGKSGIIFSQERKDTGFRSALCADVERPDLKPVSYTHLYTIGNINLCIRIRCQIATATHYATNTITNIIHGKRTPCHILDRTE